MDTILIILSMLALVLIPLSIGYFFNTSWIRPFLCIPAESTSLMGTFFLLKPPESMLFGMHCTFIQHRTQSLKLAYIFSTEMPYAIRIGLIVLFFLIADIYFKLLVYLGAGCQSEEGVALTFVQFLMIYGRKFGAHFMDLPRRVVDLEYILLDCVGSYGHVLRFGIELEDDIDLESQTHPNAPPSYDVSVDIFTFITGLY
jgi:hypothetical protein